MARYKGFSLFLTRRWMQKMAFLRPGFVKVERR